MLGAPSRLASTSERSATSLRLSACMVLRYSGFFEGRSRSVASVMTFAGRQAKISWPLRIPHNPVWRN